MILNNGENQQGLQLYNFVIWSNSLVQGETGANVLVGIQVPPAEFDEFKSHADNLGYEYMSEHNNEIYRLLLRDPKV